MKFIAPATLLLSTAAAMAIEPRQAPDNVYVTVTNLQCQPHGTTCFYTFEVRSSPGSAPLVCSARAQAAGTIPSLPNEPCADPNAVFSFEQQGAGKPASFDVTWTSDWARGVQKIHGSHVFSSADFKTDGLGTQTYVGAKEFTIGGLTTTLVIRN
ncbi:hypothetical protein RB595_009390 [Gaeumannomyces hyphopodioides]